MNYGTNPYSPYDVQRQIRNSVANRTSNTSDQIDSSKIVNNTIDRYSIESIEKWREWCQKIPYLKLKEDWNIKVIPPFAGAMARFIITKGTASVSVYLDVSDNLGVVGEPYWEIYPFDDDVMRYLMNETEALMDGIEQSLAFQNQEIKELKRKDSSTIINNFIDEI